jgi:3-hydroxyacyl-[acyl-carrier-protein] dehydratase
MTHWNRHRFDSITDYLHHRPPYLMVDQIISIEDQQIITRTQVTDARVTGHFPGAPILPGAMMQEIATQSAGILIAANYNPMSEYNTHDPFFNQYALGVLVKLGNARFRGFARPGDQLETRVSLVQWEQQLFEFKGEVWVPKKMIMRNHFWLGNIPSETLQGKAEQTI